MGVSAEELLAFYAKYANDLNQQFDEAEAELRSGRDRVVKFLNQDDPIQYVLRGFALCEEELKRITLEYAKEAKLDRPNAHAYLKALVEAGLLSKDDASCYKSLQRVRNIFAHNPDAELELKMVKDVYNTLPLAQRKSMHRNLGVDSKTIKHHPRLVLKAIILRLYTHLEGIRMTQQFTSRMQDLFSKEG